MNARNIPSFHILPDVVLAFQITKVQYHDTHSSTIEALLHSLCHQKGNNKYDKFPIQKSRVPDPPDKSSHNC